MIAERLRHVESSPTLALAAKAKALVKAGKRVLDFTAGEPDFPTPEHIKRAAIDAIERNQTKYTPAAGILELRSAVANDLSRRLGVPYAPAEVIVSTGAKQALYNALQAICDPGDEVLVLSPYWVSYLPLVRLADATPVVIETREADRFQPEPTAVKAAITNRTKAIILNSPSNPTGAVIERPRLKALAELALAKDLFVISDEIYDQMVFPPIEARSVVQEDRKILERTLLINGVSKSYSMTGWRIGYAAGPTHVIEAMTALQSHSTSNPTSISQYAALAALTGDQADVKRMAAEFHRRRDRLVNGLNQLKDLSCVMPDGAFYAWCNIGHLGQPAEVIAARWLEESLIAVVPGEGFGSSSHVRFSFATSLEAIDEALGRLRDWLQKR